MMHELTPVDFARGTMISLIAQLDFQPPAKYVGRPDWRKVKSDKKPDGRRVRREQNCIAAVERYAAALPKDVWLSTKELAERLGVSTVTVNKTLREPHMEAIVESQKVRSLRGVTRYVWRLK